MDPQNQNQYQQQQYNPYGQPHGFGVQLPPVPNATAVLILGICSIVFCGLGPILGTIAMVLAKGARAEFEGKPGVYDPGSYGSVKTGRTCGIIGICVGVLSWIGFAAYMIFVWYMMQQLQQEIMQSSHY